MARQPINPPRSLAAPKEFILPENWDKNLRNKLNDDQKKDIELKVDRYIIRNLFNVHSLNFEEVEFRLSQIIEGATSILKGFPYPHPNYESDHTHTFIEQEISNQLEETETGEGGIILGMKMHEVLDLKQAATSVMNKLKETHQPLPAHRPSNENADWLIYDLGLIFENADGNFAMPKSPGPDHPFYCFLQTINQFIPKDLQLDESNLINRSIKLIRNREKKR